MNLIRKLYKDHEQFVRYVIFGVGTTAVNMIVFYALSEMAGLNGTFSSAGAWFFSVLFAYVTNKLFVFNSRGLSLQRTLLEMIGFFGTRLATGLVDIAIIAVAVDLLHGNGMLWKLLSNIVVVILNYIAGKLLFFKKEGHN